MRLFVAAELPPEVSGALARWARGALARDRGPRRLDPETLHLTLCFLGEQPASAVGPVAAALSACRELFAAVGELPVGAPAWLPPRRPRVLAIEVGDPDGGLRALQGALVAELAASLAWTPGRERFRPHVTVARMRAGSERARELPPTPALCFAPTAATLFRSSLDPGGARYEPLTSIAA